MDGKARRCGLAEERTGMPAVWVNPKHCETCERDPAKGVLAQVIAYKLHVRIVNRWADKGLPVSVEEAAERLRALGGAAKAEGALVAAVERGMPAETAMKIAEATGFPGRSTPRTGGG